MSRHGITPGGALAVLYLGGVIIGTGVYIAG